MKAVDQAGSALQPDLRDGRLRIRPLRRADLDAVQRWPPTDDPLYEGLGRPLTMLEKESFLDQCRWPRRLELAVDDANGTLIGRLHLRDVDPVRRQARLGIIFGAPWVGQGFGSAALRLFLPYFFGEFGFHRMVLDVAASNRRALRVYEKLGFQTVGVFWREGGATRQLGWLERPEYCHLAYCFRIDGSVYWALHYELELFAADLVLLDTP